MIIHSINLESIEKENKRLMTQSDWDRFSHFILLYFILCIYFCLCWVSIAAHWLSLVAVKEGYSLVAVHRLLLPMASLVV